MATPTTPPIWAQLRLCGGRLLQLWQEEEVPTAPPRMAVVLTLSVVCTSPRPAEVARFSLDISA